MQGRPGGGSGGDTFTGGAGCTRRRSPRTDGCFIHEEKVEAQSD